jgi:hypothetical protein
MLLVVFGPSVVLGVLAFFGVCLLYLGSKIWRANRP